MSTMNISEADLREQFTRARHDWPFIRVIELDFRLPHYILFAVGSRETNLRNIIGDYGHGHGVFQLDNRSHVIPDGFMYNVEQQAQYAGRMLRSLLDHYKAMGYRKRYQAALAAYNSGTGNVDWAIRNNQDPSSVTTGHDYGLDVVTRMRYLQEAYPLSPSHPDPKPVTKPSTYTIQRGDTLLRIATRCHVTGGWHALWNANRGVIGDDPNVIKPGTVLRIP